MVSSTFLDTQAMTMAPTPATSRWLSQDTSRLPPGRSNAFDYRMDPIPAVGEHTEAILRELGRDPAAIAALRAASAI